MKSIFLFFKKNVKIFNCYRFRELQWFSSNKPQTACYNAWLQQSLWNKQSVLDIVDHFKCSHQKMTHRKMNEWKWCHHITDFFQYMHAWNQGCIKIIMISPWYNSCSAKAQEIWKNAWLQLLFYNKTGSITVWVAAVELQISCDKWNDCKGLFRRNTVT